MFWQPESGTVGYHILNLFSQSNPFYIVVYGLLILAFAYFYASIQFNPIEIANNLKKNGGFIPGFRPGKPTSATSSPRRWARSPLSVRCSSALLRSCR